jgi:hypothetical protein
MSEISDDRVILTQVDGPDDVDLLVTLKFEDHDALVPHVTTFRIKRSVAHRLLVQLDSHLPVNMPPPELAHC